jgi:hypothetical protein
MTIREFVWPRESREAKAVRQLAEAKGISQSDLVRQWVVEKLNRQKRRNHAKT